MRKLGFEASKTLEIDHQQWISSHGYRQCYQSTETEVEIERDGEIASLSVSLWAMNYLSRTGAL